MKTDERPYPYLLPRGLWVFLVALALLIITLQTTQLTGDRGMTNGLTAVAVMLWGITVLVWLAFFSAYDRRIRRGVPGAVVLGVALFFGLFRVDHVGGEMRPNFVWRFSEAADRRLEVPGPGAADPIDVVATSPTDFPQFLGPDRDASIESIALARDWQSRPPALVWRQPIGAGWSGFAVVNGYAFTQEQRGDLEMVTAYELESGDLVWSYSVENRFESVIAGIGPRATPTLDDGTVYALTSDGRLLALDGGTGSLLWEQDLLAEYGISPQQEAATIAYGRANSPLVAGRLVIVPAGGPPGGPLVSLVAFDKTTGAKAWEGGDRQISYSSPAVATLVGIEQILILNEASAAGHDLESGRQLWTFERPGVSNADPNVSQAVAVPPNRVFVSKGYGLGAALLELEAGPGGNVTVRELWGNGRVLRTKFTNVTIYDGHVYGLSDGILECVDLESGERVWKHGRYHQGQILRVRDLLVVMSEEGEVFLIEATPVRPDNVLGSFQALSGKTWNTFAISGPYLAVRNAEEAAVFRLPLAE